MHTTSAGKCTYSHCMSYCISYNIPAGEIRTNSTDKQLQTTPAAVEMYHSGEMCTMSGAVEMRTTSGVEMHRSGAVEMRNTSSAEIHHSGAVEMHSTSGVEMCTILVLSRCTPLLVLRCTILVLAGGWPQLIWCGLRNPQGQRPLPQKSITLFQPQPLTIPARSSSSSPS